MIHKFSWQLFGNLAKKKISTNMKETLYNVLVDVKCKDVKCKDAKDYVCKDANIFGLTL